MEDIIFEVHEAAQVRTDRLAHYKVVLLEMQEVCGARAARLTPFEDP